MCRPNADEGGIDMSFELYVKPNNYHLIGINLLKDSKEYKYIVDLSKSSGVSKSVIAKQLIEYAIKHAKDNK